MVQEFLQTYASTTNGAKKNLKGSLTCASTTVYQTYSVPYDTAQNNTGKLKKFVLDGYLNTKLSNS